MDFLKKMNAPFNPGDSAEARWLKKPVEKAKPIPLTDFTLSGRGMCERTADGFILTTSAEADDNNTRPISFIKLGFTGEDWHEYNRISVSIYPEATGFPNFYFHFTLTNRGTKPYVHAPSVIPNQWNQVVWEISEHECSDIVSLSFGPVLLGCPPEALPNIKFYFKDIEVQKVEPDHILGWKLDDRIAFCHGGYFTGAEKIALTQYAKSDHFEVLSEKSGERFRFPVKLTITELGSYCILDFSALDVPGEYRLALDERISGPFSISAFPYRSALIKSIAFLKTLRCGDDVPGVHSPCHLNCYTFHPDGRMLPNHGGWHDAGDVSQFEICTAEIAHAVFETAAALPDGELREEILAEGRWGVNWLLRTRFGDGYRALAVLYSIWRDNVISGTDGFSKKNVAENGPFENFLAAAAEAVAARLYRDSDPVFAQWCARAAAEDFRFGVDGRNQGLFTKRWGKLPAAQECGQGALAAAELYLLTGERQYRDQGAEYAQIVLACQERTLPPWERPLRGFFYKNPDHAEILNYEHRGHEQAPVCGLARLCEVAPDHPDAPKWREGLELYREYILATADIVVPYGLLPAYIYDTRKINLGDHTFSKTVYSEEAAMTSLVSQAEGGIRLAEHVYLRRFPIAVSRRGYHATLLSKTKAVTAVAKVLNDKNLAQIAIRQLEWVLGKNPFASSTMYGEGYNYHPLYVAFSAQMVGALPVGIQTSGALDAPYWPVANNSVYKEIWGHTTGKFLGVLADLLSILK
jgi:hypothetical protein